MLKRQRELSNRLLDVDAADADRNANAEKGRDGDPAATRVRYDEDARWLVMQRGEVTVVCNFSEERRRVPLDAGRGRHVLAACCRPEVREAEGEMDPGAVVLGE